MNEGKIVIVEGTSCVGKTTLCEELKKLGWIVLPEAIRYLEQETGKSGDEASPIPGSQEEEEYYQDQLFRIEKQKILEANKLKKQGKTMVFVTHSMGTVKKLCNRAIWLKDGLIKMDGDTEKVVDEYIKENS